jgi:hypothetical protein
LRQGILFVVLLAVSATCGYAGFVNGGFETGDMSSWTATGGSWHGGWPMNPANYNNPSQFVGAVVTPGPDPIVGAALNRVYSGSYSVRVNDRINDYTVGVISQTVTDYTDPNIYFAWSAVLEGSHVANDSDNFTLALVDVTAGNEVLVNRSYSSYSATGLFNNTNGWYWTPWQTEQLSVGDRQHHTFTLTLLASDCPYGGHAGYVYLDGFGAAAPIQGDPSVPEPASMGLIGLGLAGLVWYRRRK